MCKELSSQKWIFGDRGFYSTQKRYQKMQNPFTESRSEIRFQNDDLGPEVLYAD